MPPPSLAVVVPATDDAIHLAQCLAALQEAQGPEDEILVVRADGAPPLPPGTRVVAHVADSGPAAARNVGSRIAGGDVLVFVDADVCVAPDFLDRIRRLFAERPDLDAVFGAYDAGADGQGLVTGFRNLLHHHVHRSSAGPATTFWTGLGAIRRERYLAAGGLDDSLRFLEDIELGNRLSATGAVVELDPSLSGTHLKEYTLWEMVHTDLFDRGVPWVRLIIEGRASSDALNAGGVHRVSAVLVAGAAAAAFARRPVLAMGAATAFLALNRDFHRLLRARLGWRGAVAGPALHALHLAVSGLSVPVGVAFYLRARGSAGPGPAGPADAHVSPIDGGVDLALAGPEGRG